MSKTLNKEMAALDSRRHSNNATKTVDLEDSDLLDLLWFPLGAPVPLEEGKRPIEHYLKVKWKRLRTSLVSVVLRLIEQACASGLVPKHLAMWSCLIFTSAFEP